MPDFRAYGLKVEKPGQIDAENTRPLGAFLRDVMKLNMNRFRVFGPDENTSNKLQDIYEVSKKFWIAEYFPEDADGGELATDGEGQHELAKRRASRSLNCIAPTSFGQIGILDFLYLGDGGGEVARACPVPYFLRSAFDSRFQRNTAGVLIPA